MKSERSSPQIAAGRVQVESLDRDSGALDLYAPHRANGRFFNPWAPFPHSFARLVSFWARPRPRSLRRELEVPLHFTDELPRIDADGAAVTWVGHCTFILRAGGSFLVTDPHWGPGPLARRREIRPGVPLSVVPASACALVSHSHYDHLDVRTIRQLPQSTRWIVPLGIGLLLRRWGHDNVIELDWWQRCRVGPWELTCLPAQHWSMRWGHGKNRSLWCSWLIRSESRSFYFAGDGGYFHGFAEYGRRFGPLDVALLPVGTYEPRWFLEYQHMSPQDAYRAFLDLRANHLIPMHWGTFQMAWDIIDEAPGVLKRHVQESMGDLSRVHPLGIGETWKLP